MIGSAPLDLADPVDPPEPDSLRRDPRLETVRDDRHEALRRAFLALPEGCRRLLAYTAAVDRPDYDEIAVSLGMKRGSIGPTRGRCLNKLRKLLEADPAWNRAVADAGPSQLSEDDPLDADDTRIIAMVDELHERYGHDREKLMEEAKERARAGGKEGLSRVFELSPDALAELDPVMAVWDRRLCLGAVGAGLRVAPAVDGSVA
jgi:hypothetical protein